MRLLRLKLQNWRGVEAREIQFAHGVTLIEGPNEIGKSTIVEAVLTLFTVMDSSSKADIKAIQPVGQDVGSAVEVEVKAGDYHFVYAKTYNKNKQTALRILSPQAAQLTGREAHERVEQMLEETVDMPLWHALLVEQGSEIAGVTLAQSDGLARALDEAAGGEMPEQDDSGLFARVQSEYEQYFTLKSGKARHAALEVEVANAQAGWEEAKQALADIETDSLHHERCLAEIVRLESQLPDLGAEEKQYEADWAAVGQVKDEIAAKQRQLDDARALLSPARDEVERRNQLVQNIAQGQQANRQAREQLSPRAQTLAQLQDRAAAALAALTESKTRLSAARGVAQLTRADVQHLENVTQLDSIDKTLARFQSFNSNLERGREALQGIKINPEGLEALRTAANELEVAIAKRDTASSSIEILAEDELSLMLDEQTVSLSANGREQRDITAEVNLRIPGVVSIRVTPSQSANELDVSVDEHRATLAQLCTTYGVVDLPHAIAVEAQRAQDAQDVLAWRGQINDLLGETSPADLEAAQTELRASIAQYQATRAADPALPETLEQAQRASVTAEAVRTELEAMIEGQQSGAEALQAECAALSAQIQVGQQELAGAETLVAQRQAELERSRATADDAQLNARVEQRVARVTALLSELQELQEQLDSAAPVTAEALFMNAQAARKRAENDLATLRTDLAVVEDRLTKAQADGRFDAVEQAEHNYLALADKWSGTTARAAAVGRLWQVLNSHRDAARKVYVRPLQEGIEQLGKIVFGADFTVELGDDWRMVSRTQNGRTIAFDDLSVGAKEQLGILMRLAAARIVSKQGGVPLIIDDALGFSDPTRLKTMGAAIASAGQDCQIILLTCTPGRFTHVGRAEVVRF